MGILDRRNGDDFMKQKLGISKNIDMIHGPIFQSLVLFALPLLGSNIFQQFYNTMDTMIVGNYLGDASLAAIGVCTPIYDLLVGFALGIGNGLAPEVLALEIWSS